jgi:predicted nucleic acid-binding Zn ribbon protein
VRVPACASVPLAVTRRFNRARDLVGRAGGSADMRRARTLARHAGSLLDEAAWVVTRAARRHVLDDGCARTLETVLADARARALGWARQISVGP